MLDFGGMQLDFDCCCVGCLRFDLRDDVAAHRLLVCSIDGFEVYIDSIFSIVVEVLRYEARHSSDIRVEHVFVIEGGFGFLVVYFQRVALELFLNRSPSFD